MPKDEHRYTKDELTVIWRPMQCIHSTKCWKGLINVFDPRKKPWINLEGAEQSSIIEQVKACPSGALSFQFGATEPEM